MRDIYRITDLLSSVSQWCGKKMCVGEKAVQD